MINPNPNINFKNENKNAIGIYKQNYNSLGDQLKSNIFHGHIFSKNENKQDGMKERLEIKNMCVQFMKLSVSDQAKYRNKVEKRLDAIMLSDKFSNDAKGLAGVFKKEIQPKPELKVTFADDVVTKKEIDGALKDLQALGDSGSEEGFDIDGLDIALEGLKGLGSESENDNIGKALGNLQAFESESENDNNDNIGKALGKLQAFESESENDNNDNIGKALGNLQAFESESENDNIGKALGNLQAFESESENDNIGKTLGDLQASNSESESQEDWGDIDFNQLTENLNASGSESTSESEDWDTLKNFDPGKIPPKENKLGS